MRGFACVSVDLCARAPSSSDHSQGPEVHPSHHRYVCMVYVCSKICCYYLYTGVTGNALPEDIAKFIACGANKVLTKPLTKAKLFDALAMT